MHLLAFNMVMSTLLTFLQLEDAVDQAAFDKAFNGCEWRYDIDGLSHTVPFEKRKVFITEVAKFFTIIKCKGMLDALLEGLKYYEVKLVYMHFHNCLQTFQSIIHVTI